MGVGLLREAMAQVLSPRILFSDQGKMDFREAQYDPTNCRSEARSHICVIHGCATPVHSIPTAARCGNQLLTVWVSQRGLRLHPQDCKPNQTNKMQPKFIYRHEYWSRLSPGGSLLTHQRDQGKVKDKTDQEQNVLM